MTDTPSKEQLKYAFDRVIPDEEMALEEKAEYLAEHPEALMRALRDAGFGKARPSDIATGFYRGQPSETTTVDPQIAKAVRKRFPDQPTVEPCEPSESPSLGLFYGGSVETQAGSSKGDYIPDDSD